MLNRRLIRVKILQLLYGFYRGNGLDGRACEKQLLNSEEQYITLLHYISALPVQLVREAKARIARGKRKYRPSPEELNPNLRFVQNGPVAVFAANTPFSDFTHHHGVNWSAGNNEFIPLLLDRLTQQEFYRAYMAGIPQTPSQGAEASLSEENSQDPSEETPQEEGQHSSQPSKGNTLTPQWREDRDFALTLLDWLCSEEMVEVFLSEHDLFWETDLQFAADVTLHTWRNLSSNHPSDRPIIEQRVPQNYAEYGVKLLRQLLLSHQECQGWIQQAVHNWDPERISAIDLLTIEIGIVEAIHFPDIPVRVTLNECIEIAHTMSTPQSPGFVNGVLDRIITDLSGKGRVLKNNSYNPNAPQA